MRVIGFVLIVNALAIIPRTIFIRNINFKTQTKVSLIASISSGVVGIGMALSGMGVWSLVGQQLSRQLLNTVFCGGIVSGSLFLSFLPRVSRKCLVLVPNYLFPDCWILFIRIFIIWS